MKRKCKIEFIDILMHYAACACCLLNTMHDSNKEH